MLYASTQAGDHGHPRAPARVGPFVISIVEIVQQSHVNLEIQSVTAKGSHELPSQHGDFSILDRTERSTRAHRRVTTVTRARPRAWGPLCFPWERTYNKTHVNLEIQSGTA